MSWTEFCDLINGLSANSPLGRIIQIRAEDDPEILKEFTSGQKKIRNAYQRKKAVNKSLKEREAYLGSLKKAFIEMAGGISHD